jgi:hypothetical protein
MTISTGNYTHAQWRIQAQGLTDALERALVGALTHIHGGLVHVEAGQTQLATSREWIRLVSELGTEGHTILGDHDPRLTHVSQAQQQAGGVREVAGDKRYNQH